MLKGSKQKSAFELAKDSLIAARSGLTEEKIIEEVFLALSVENKKQEKLLRKFLEIEPATLKNFLN